MFPGESRTRGDCRSSRVEAKGKVIYVWFDAPIGYIRLRVNGPPTGRSRAMEAVLAG